MQIKLILVKDYVYANVKNPLKNDILMGILKLLISALLFSTC